MRMYRSIWSYRRIESRVLDAAAGGDLRTKWIASQIEFSQICSRITEAHGDTSSEKQLGIELEEWRETLSSQYRDINQSHPRNMASDGRKLWLFCCYHEANLRIQPSHPGNECTSLMSNAAKIILEATSVLPTAVVTHDRQAHSIPASVTNSLDTNA